MKERLSNTNRRSYWDEATFPLKASAVVWAGVAKGVYDNMKKSGTLDVARLKAREVLINTGVPPGVAGFLIGLFSDEPQTTI